MKLFTTIRLLLFATVLQSCKTDNVYFSCDPKIDQWVKNNYESINIMTSDEWNSIGEIGRQRAIYNAFSPLQRQNLWIEKFKRALPFFANEDEKSHLKSLLFAIEDNLQWFEDNNNDSQRNSFDLFFYKWNDYAKNTLNWNSNTLYALIGTPENISHAALNDYTVNSLQNVRLSKTRSEDGYGNVCDCGDNSQYYFTCPGVDGFTCEIEYNNPCRQTQHGCGSLWRDACWGKCKKPKITSL